MDSAKVMTVIVTETIAERGTEEDLVRAVTEYWSLDGNRLAIRDPYLEGSMESASSRASSASI